MGSGASMTTLERIAHLVALAAIGFVLFVGGALLVLLDGLLRLWLP